MKLFSACMLTGAAVLPSATAWGGKCSLCLVRPRILLTAPPGFGHITVAYVASSFVNDHTATYFQTLLRNQSDEYLAGVATWADSIRYTKWGHFTGPFHFIDAKDQPPSSCDIDMARDCKAEGCVISALQNYTTRLIDAGGKLVPEEREQAAKFVVHFVGDMHQPLHAEDVAKGGNGIRVQFDGVTLNLHHVWDTSIPEKIVGGVHGSPYDEARTFADQLVAAIRGGKFKAQSQNWLRGISLDDIEGTALIWARESNAYVCTHGMSSSPFSSFSLLHHLHLLLTQPVLPQGPEGISGQELGSSYYEDAAPVVEVQIARAGFRLATWLDFIAARIDATELSEL